MCDIPSSYAKVLGETNHYNGQYLSPEPIQLPLKFAKYQKNIEKLTCLRNLDDHPNVSLLVYCCIVKLSFVTFVVEFEIECSFLAEQMAFSY